jgi:hypothetical protein
LTAEHGKNLAGLHLFDGFADLASIFSNGGPMVIAHTDHTDLATAYEQFVLYGFISG